MTFQVIQPAGDPQVADLATPINSSGFTRSLLQTLSAYRQGLSPFRRALEVGLVHGYFIVGPFVKFGPLRDTATANLAGALSAAGLIVTGAIMLVLYGGSHPPAPLNSVVATAPRELDSAKDWQQYAGGFLLGGLGGVALAGALLELIARLPLT